MVTKGRYQSACFIGMSVLSSLLDIKSRTCVSLTKRLRQTFLRLYLFLNKFKLWKPYSYLLCSCRNWCNNQAEILTTRNQCLVSSVIYCNCNCTNSKLIKVWKPYGHLTQYSQTKIILLFFLILSVKLC